MIEEQDFKFTHLKVENFRGLINFECDFDDDYNEITGENSTGKTTVLSSILWCLFGKDLYERKTFPITPIIDGEVRKEMTTRVELTINRSFVIERTWDNVKSEIRYGFIDSQDKKNMVKTTQGNFNTILLQKFVEEEEFKALSNINYLPNLPWQKLKDFIYNLIGEVTDEEVLEKVNMPLCENFIRNLGFIALSNKLKETKNLLNIKITRLENEINYATQLKIKYLSEKEEVEELKKIKAELEKELANYNNLLNIKAELQKQYSDYSLKINTAKEQMQNLISKGNSLSNENNDLKAKITAINPDIEYERMKDTNEVKQRKMSLKYDKERYAQEIDIMTKTKEVLKEQGETLNAKEVKIEKDTCSYCGSKLSKEVIEETLQKMKDAKDKELQEIKEKYDQTKDKIAELQEKVEQIENQEKQCDEEIETIKTKVYDFSTTYGQQREYETKIKENEALKEQLGQQYKELLNLVQTLTEEQSKITWKEPEPPFAIQKRLEEINKKLSTTVALESLNAEIESKQKEYDETISEKDMLYRKEQELTLFNETKGDILKERISHYFDMVEFATVKQKKDGTYEQCFELMYKGIPYNELNSAHKIKVAIDLALGIQKLKHKKIPILIDSVEVITNLPKYDTQTIVTRSIKQDVPKLLVNGR